MLKPTYRRFFSDTNTFLPNTKAGWWFPSEKYESVGMMTFPIYGKMFQTTNQKGFLPVINFWIPGYFWMVYVDVPITVEWYGRYRRIAEGSQHLII